MIDMLAAIIVISVVILLFFGYIFLITPKITRRIEDKYLNARYAHRGLHTKDAPENSMKAFERAVEKGFGIELDVRFSKDKKLVVFHDRTLDRVTAEKGNVCDRTAKELSQISLEGTDQTVPLFEDVLALVDGRVPLLVEIKQDPDEADVASEACRILKGYSGDYIVESFNPLALVTVKKKLPKACRGLLCDRFTEQDKYKKPLYYLLQAMILNFLCKPDFIAYNHKAGQGLSVKLVKNVYKTPFLAWTVRSPEDEKIAKEKGFCSVIFENYDT